MLTILPYNWFKLVLTRHDCYRDYLQYTKFLNKCDKCECRLNFLEKCRNSDIIPNFLKFRIPNNGCFEDQSVHDFQRRLLHKEIHKANKDFLKYEQTLSDKRYLLKQLVPSEFLPSVVYHFPHERIRSRLVIKNRHINKLRLLSMRQNKPLFNVEDTIKVIDFDKPIPSYVKETLSLGPRNPVLEKFDEKEVLIELDCFLNYCKSHDVPNSTITDINVKTLHYKKTCKKQSTPRHIEKTKKF